MARRDATSLSCCDRGDAVISSRFLTNARARRLLDLALVTTTVLTAAGACVVNPTATQFSSQDSCPPYFLADQSTQATNVIDSIDPSQPGAKFTATVPIKSCAVAKNFVGRTFLDGQRNFFIQEDVFNATGTDQRPATVTIPVLGTLSEGCHRIELYASSGFAPGDVRAPATPGDLAYIVWFVYVHKPGDPDSPISECSQ
jgi:hypothetical protein